MKKLRNITWFGLPGILFFILVFCGIHLLEAKKPKETYVWEVQIPSLAEADGNSLNIYGMDNYTYSNDNDYITVKIIKDRVKSDPYYWIRFFVHSNPEDIWVGFREINIQCDGDCVTYDGEWCGVPLPYNSYGSPGCITSFLNETLHPHEGYDHFMLLFYIFEDLEAMAVGTTLPLHGRSWGNFYLWEFDCYDLANQTPDPYYHRIIGKMPSVHNGECYFYVTRVDEDTWKFQYRNANITITENYCDKELITSGKKGKGRSYYIETHHDPLEGTVPNFALEFTLKKKTS